MSGRIPPELVLLVLQHIAVPLEYQYRCIGDLYTAQRAAKKNLANCSLVSRRWVGVAQSLLFQDLRLHILYDEVGYRTIRMRYDSWEKVTEFIQRSPHVRRQLHTLSLKPLLEDPRLPWVPILRIDIDTVVKFVEYFPHLKSLQLSGFKFSAPSTPSPTIPASLHAFQYSVLSITPDNTLKDEFQSTFSPFSHAHTLFFENINFYHEALVLPTWFSDFNNLTSFHMRNSQTSRYILEHLATLAQSGLPHFREATFGTFWPNDVAQLNRFMEATDGRLRSLTLELQSRPAAYDVIAFSRHKSLTTLGLYHDAGTGGFHGMHCVWDRLVGFMGSLSNSDEEVSPPFQTLIIHGATTLDYTPQYPGVVVEYRVLPTLDSMIHFQDTILATLAHLRRVIFIPPKRNVNDSSTYSEVERIKVREAFPSFEARGLIQFERDASEC